MSPTSSNSTDAQECTPGRTFAIGDVHGCDVSLDVLLTHLELTAQDQIVLLGDLVDRGPNSRGVIERLLEARRTCEIVLVLGNHEEMFLEALERQVPSPLWLENGGRETLASYGGRLADVPAAHQEFLAAARPYLETGREIFIHANLEPGVELESQTPEWLRWRRLTGHEFPHPSGKRVICGHTPISTGLPLVRDGWVALDTLAYRGLFLTALDVATNQIFQSRQSGDYRCGVTLADLG